MAINGSQCQCLMTSAPAWTPDCARREKKIVRLRCDVVYRARSPTSLLIAACYRGPAARQGVTYAREATFQPSRQVCPSALRVCTRVHTIHHATDPVDATEESKPYTTAVSRGANESLNPSSQARVLPESPRSPATSSHDVSGSGSADTGCPIADHAEVDAVPHPPCGSRHRGR